MKIMAFEAHPDDIDFYCAGTLAKYRKLGCEVGVAVSTMGEIGSSTMEKEDVAKLRESEARKSAAVLGAEFFWMGYPDEFLFNSADVRLNFIETIRKFRPDIIITSDKDTDYHPDHTTTGQIIWDTHVMVTIPHIETDSPACDKIPEIYFMDNIMGINFHPEFYVDITDEWETKMSMISCHKSQESWMMDMYGVTNAEFAQTHARYRGFQSGCKYAECFRKPKSFPGTVRHEALLG